MGETIQSRVRVFLSADLVGSTKLKNRLNHQELLDKYRTRRHVIAKLRQQDQASERRCDKPTNSPAPIRRRGTVGRQFDGLIPKVQRPAR